MIRSFSTAPDVDEDYHRQANELVNNGNLDGAIYIYKTALINYPNDCIARKNLADLLLRQGDLANAILEYENAIKINPGDSDVRESLRSIHEKNEDVQGRISAYDSARKENHESLKEIYNDAMYFYDNGNTDLAIKKFNDALQIAYNDNKIRHELASIHFENDNYEGARDQYRIILKTAPWDEIALSNLVESLIGLQDLIGARREYSRLLKYKPPYESSEHLHVANKLLRIGDLRGAKRHYREALKNGLGDYRAHLGLCHIFQLLGNSRLAEHHASLCMQNAPTDSDVKDKIDFIFNDMNDLAGAKIRYEEALSNDPDNVKNRRSLMNVYSALGDKQGALFQQLQILKLKKA